MTITDNLLRHLRRPPSVYIRRARQQFAQTNRKPIYINGHPKSGSTFIYENLAHGLFRKTSFPLSKSFVLQPVRLETMLRDRTIVHDHMPATAHNLGFLNGKLEKLVIQVRDPRQALLSWFMNLDAAVRDPNSIKNTGLVLGIFPNYPKMSLAEKLDILIEYRMQWMIDWIHGWVSASEDPDFAPEILFIRQEDLKGSSRPVFEKILDFYEIDHALFDFPEPPKPGRHSFRKGDSNEWRSVFTEEQKERATSMIPERLFERFGWTK